MRKIILGFFILASCSILAYSIDETRLLREPATNGTQVVFVYGGDLWIVPISGGEAKRLTSHPGLEISPKFSPDGTLIAFTGEYDGNQDVYVISPSGGEPKRLTYHPDEDLVEGWSPDSGKILFSSSRYSTRKRYNRLLTVDVSGGFPEPLPMPMAEMGSFSPDGKSIAYTLINNKEYRWWKNYRGGQTTPIWIFNLADYGSIELPHENAPDRFPMWMGSKIYFVSDRDDSTMNLFSFDVESAAVKRITNYRDFDIKWAASGGGMIVFEYSGFVFRFDTRSNEVTKISIHVPSERIETRPKYVRVGSFIKNWSLSPSGQRAAFEAYGEILTVPSHQGDIRNLTKTSDACERYPSWSPDGQSIAFYSDQSGEYELLIVDQKGATPPVKINLGGRGFFYSPVWSPDGKKIALTDNHLNLYFVDLSLRRPVLVDSDTYDFEERSMSPRWSPDGRWIAYAKRLDNYLRSVHLYDSETGKIYQITDGMSDAISPVFDRSGKYLYFAASTNSALATYWLDLSSFTHRLTRNIYAVILRDDLPSPLAAKSDEEAAGVQTEKPTPNDFRVDLKNMDKRIISLPIPPQLFTYLAAGKEGTLFFCQTDPESKLSSLSRFDLRDGKTMPVISGIDVCEISRDGEKLLYRSKEIWGIIESGAPAKVGDGKIDTLSMEIKLDPRAAWKQMFTESWRVNRDFFYDPGMHGTDWKSIQEKYEPWLLYVSHRSDLNYLIGEMIGELHVGHAYIDYGDLPKPERVNVGLLGADYEVIGNRYRIKKIYRALHWNPELTCPLDTAGAVINEGDFILRVNGEDLVAPASIYKLFERTAGKRTTLTVNSRPSLEGSRTQTVVPIEDESPLRVRNWVEENRKRVEDLTGGRVGYVYIPNTGWGGLKSFDRYYYAQVNKEAVIIDERFNSGGWLPDYFIDMLDRPLLGYWVPRAGKIYSTPAGSIRGPRVMLINEYSASGGDALAFYFKTRGLGKLVGKRTWGGLVCVYDYPDLMDGGYISAPRLRILSPDGKWVVENIGVFPDVEVEMSPSQVILGKDPQLEKAVAIVLEELKRTPMAAPRIPPFPVKK